MKLAWSKSDAPGGSRPREIPRNCGQLLGRLDGLLPCLYIAQCGASSRDLRARFTEATPGLFTVGERTGGDRSGVVPHVGLLLPLSLCRDARARAALGDIPALTFGRNAAAGPGRPALAHAEAQAESVAALCAPGSRSALGDTVTVKAVIDAAARGNLLHIVLHSVAGRFSPGQTALALGQDGLLDAQRVAAESWNTPLVFLVSCETVDRRGRGLDLPRAFLAGGAGCVLASPIKVPDSSGEDFALLFYRHLREGLSADEALRRTKLDRGASPHEQADPCTWAPWQILRSAR